MCLTEFGKSTEVTLLSSVFVSSLGIVIKAKEAKKLRDLLRLLGCNYRSLSLYLFFLFDRLIL